MGQLYIDEKNESFLRDSEYSGKCLIQWVNRLDFWLEVIEIEVAWIEKVIFAHETYYGVWDAYDEF